MLVCMAMGSALMAKTTETGSAGTTNAFPRIAETAEEGWFPLSEATICTDA